MSFLRRPLLLLLDHRPPLWASSGLWTAIGVTLVFLALAADRGPWRWTPLFAGLALVILSGLARFLRQSQLEWYRKQLTQRGAGLCPRCGYNLQGLTDPKCPECGTDIDAATREAARILSKDI